MQRWREARDDSLLGEPALQLAAFGDPQYPESLSQSQSQDDALASYDGRVNANIDRGGRFSPLSFSRSEVERIASLFSNGTRVFVGLDATEENAKALPRDTRIVHFAVHGSLDEGLPLDSSLALTIPEVFREGSENGLFQVWEIMENFRLDADLVVLSACDTGLGRDRRGRAKQSFPSLSLCWRPFGSFFPLESR
jgi:CHAT domain-containing protein